MHRLKPSSSAFGVYGLVIFLSILFGLINNFNDVVINPDAICYLLSAESMKDGLHTAMHLCDQAKWPFYSILIYCVQKFTAISYFSAAILLNSLFYLMTIVTFISIIHFFHSSRRLLILAAFVILCAHEFMALQDNIIRDHGFWAFYLISIRALLNFVKDPRGGSAWLWGGSLIVATLFRIEGALFLIVLPFVMLLVKGNRRAIFTKLCLPLLIMFCVFATIFYLQPVPEMGRIAELKFQVVHGWSTVAHRFQVNVETISAHLLNRYSRHEASSIFIATFFIWYFLNVIKNVSYIYTFLIVLTWIKKLLPVDTKIKWVLWSYIFLNVLITSIFLAENMFLSKRYLMALSLTLMIFVPFALNYLYEHHKKLFYGVIILIFIPTVGGMFHFGTSKKYIKEAGIWAEHHLPLNSSLYSNDYQFMYYSQHFGKEIFTKAKEYNHLKTMDESFAQNYDYVALRSSKDETVKVNPKLGKSLITFANHRGDAITIYKIKKS